MNLEICSALPLIVSLFYQGLLRKAEGLCMFWSYGCRFSNLPRRSSGVVRSNLVPSKVILLDEEAKESGEIITITRRWGYDKVKKVGNLLTSTADWLSPK